MKFFWVKLEKYLNYLLIFLLPTQLAFHFWPLSSFVFGIRVDYLSPTIYLTDILFLLLFSVWVIRLPENILRFIRRDRTFLFILIFFIFLNLSVSLSITPSLYKWLKFIELLLFFYYVKARSDLFKLRSVSSALFYSLVFFSIIGILQVLFGRTLGGLLYILGERSFSASTPGIALVEIFGRNYLRAYSTFSHPNSLAGYLCMGLIATLFAFSKKDLTKKGWGLIIICLALVLSFSLSVFIGILICGLLYFLFQKRVIKTRYFILIPSAFLLISLLLPFVSKIILNNQIYLPQNISQRAILTSVSGNIISRNFLLGTGLNTFVIAESGIKVNGSYSWILQPVHNLFLLVFSETGVIGLLLFYGLLMLFTKKAISLKNKLFYFILVYIMVTGLTDHYWFTLQQNLFLLAFILGNSFSEKG